MEEIQLTQNKVVLVDDDDFPRLSQHKWFAHYCLSTKDYYAVRNGSRKLSKRTLIWMHREIMKATKGQEIDHINGNRLNNSKSNLRFCNHTQNMQNKQRKGIFSSQYKGVCWHKNHKIWEAKITYYKKQINLGYFKDEIQAAKAYDKKAKELFGEFACLNFK